MKLTEETKRKIIEHYESLPIEEMAEESEKHGWGFFPLHEKLYGMPVIAYGSLVSVHIWNEELALRNMGRFRIEPISWCEYEAREGKVNSMKVVK